MEKKDPGGEPGLKRGVWVGTTMPASRPHKRSVDGFSLGARSNPKQWGRHSVGVLANRAALRGRQLFAVQACKIFVCRFVVGIEEKRGIEEQHRGMEEQEKGLQEEEKGMDEEESGD